MKLPDALRRNQEGDPLDERIAAELDALDSALRGEQVDPEMSSLATMATDLRADREEIENDFSARLDAWAAAGFPRGERPGTSPSKGSSATGAIERLRLRIASTPPRRVIGPAMAAASVAVIAAVAISHSGEISGSGESSSTSTGGSATSAAPAPGTPTFDAQSASGGGAAADSTVTPDSSSSAGSAGSGAESSDGGAASSGDTVRRAPQIAAQAAPLNGQRLEAKRQGNSFSERSLNAPSPGDARGQNLNEVRKNRKVERDAQLSLKADAKDVPTVASRASDVTEHYSGHVLSSQVTGSSESARATLELAIPSKNLDAAIADLADLAEVSSRSEGSNDITRSFVTARDQLSGFRAERDSLLKRLAAATTDQETADLKAKLSQVNDQIAQARGSVDKLNSRASISKVSLEISSDGMIGSPGDDNSGWDIGDALHDAGHVLVVAGGVILISGAVLLPLAIIALIAFVILRGSRTRARERALDE